MGSTMVVVPLGRELVSSHRLSVQTTLESGTVWPQFAMQFLIGGCLSLVWGEGVGGGSPG